ncbi:NAD(P)-dependent oxidoreductase [Hazenella sp. IB182357]|uniref:NAD(P)-dependent oxidoreductase n=1 Tax=Polycladospora coralii TaxID=2771432 RepID=A0A926N9B9_9BACL|nr:NAD(P)-dependent oxidoreductase [Polycladospora coralii]MBD1372561.1 NAD(P)-dependent oxidoreductase [Polycladospora coralii]MBS7531316.1 NAD(P)-dependent oxidoreductase [Polycladospora coralii]
MDQTTVIGMIGIGVMGKSIAGHLLSKGYQVHVYTRTKSKAEDLITRGAIWKDSPKEIATSANVIFTMVGYPQDVAEVYLGKEGLIAHVDRGTYLVDMTTSKPSLAKEIYEQALAKQVFALDAPVSGGDIGAREARLSIMVGGDREVFDRIKPLFELIGTHIIYQGEAGAGQHTKMCNQITIASNMIGVTEALIYAEQAGLNPKQVLQSIETGAAGSWSLSQLGPRMLKGDYDPGFYVKHFIKDMAIALEAAEEMKLTLPGLKLAKHIYDQLVALGEEESGTQVLFKHFMKINPH